MAALRTKISLTSTDSRDRIKEVCAIATRPDEAIDAAAQDLKNVGIGDFAGVTQDTKWRIAPAEFADLDRGIERKQLDVQKQQINATFATLVQGYAEAGDLFDDADVLRASSQTIRKQFAEEGVIVGNDETQSARGLILGGRRLRSASQA